MSHMVPGIRTDQWHAARVKARLHERLRDELAPDKAEAKRARQSNFRQTGEVNGHEAND